MAMMKPEALPPGRSHLDENDRAQLIRFELLLEQRRFNEAHDVVEGLWVEATDAHKGFYQGLANGLAAVCAREARQNRGAVQISSRTRSMLSGFPRRVLGIELDAFLESVHVFVERGEGPVLLLHQG